MPPQDTTPTKRCPKCGETKPLEEFHRCKTGALGRYAYCKPCIRAYHVARKDNSAVQAKARAWRDVYRGRPDVQERKRQIRQQNPERYNGYSRAWRARNPDQVRDGDSRRYAQDPEKYRAMSRRWYRNNLAIARATGAKYRAANRAYMRVLNAAWRAANPDKMRAAKRSWVQRNLEKVVEQAARRRALENSAPIIEKIDRKAIIARDNGTCYLCGRVLSLHEVTLDHYIPLSAGGPHTAENLRVACRPCNSRKWTHLPDATKRSLH